MKKAPFQAHQSFCSLISPQYGASCHPSILALEHTKYFSVIAEDAQHFFKIFCQFIISPFSPCQKELQAVIRKSMMQKHICRSLYRSCLLFDAFQTWLIILHHPGPTFMKCQWRFLWIYLKLEGLSSCADQATYVSCWRLKNIQNYIFKISDLSLKAMTCSCVACVGISHCQMFLEILSKTFSAGFNVHPVS